MCLQLATVLPPSLLLSQQEEIWLCAGPLTSERCICALFLLLAKVRPGASSKKRQGKSIHVPVLDSFVLAELEDVQKRLVSIRLSWGWRRWRGWVWKEGRDKPGGIWDSRQWTAFSWAAKCSWADYRHLQGMSYGYHQGFWGVPDPDGTSQGTARMAEYDWSPWCCTSQRLCTSATQYFSLCGVGSRTMFVNPVLNLTAWLQKQCFLGRHFVGI